MATVTSLAPWSVKCRCCGAEPGVQCESGVTGQPLRRAIAHHLRIRDAYPDLEPMEDDD